MVCLTALFMVAGSVWYIFLVFKGKIQTVLAAWIILGITNALGLFTYWHSQNHSFIAGIGIIAANWSTDSILIAVLIKQWGKKVTFNNFQKGCLMGSSMILVVWVILRFVIGGETAAFYSHLLTIFMMIIGYSPLVIRLKSTMAEKESLLMWMAICIASATSIYPAVEHRNFLSTLYGIRGVLSAGLVAYYIIKIRWTNNKSFYQLDSKSVES